jgi:hypothetical protein
MSLDITYWRDYVCKYAGCMSVLRLLLLDDGLIKCFVIGTDGLSFFDKSVCMQLLKKSGWKEGTGLGATEQGRLDPVETHLKQDRRGIGADLKKSKAILSSEERRSQRKALKVSICAISNPCSCSLDCGNDDITNFTTVTGFFTVSPRRWHLVVG